ncbi:MAG: formate dehydrogenase subunit alpha [Methanomassiliicoccales archaeon]|nr:MAG: formate dehydrogenase subunit alpha [Methanomassiliicoccales archaeon]
MGEITLNIDGQDIRVEEGETILSAAQKANIYIPALCADPDLKPIGTCRLCLVEIEGKEEHQLSCDFLVQDKMVIRTNTSEIREVRRRIIEVIRTDHANDCQLCPKNENCELQDAARSVGVEVHKPNKLAWPSEPDRSHVFFNLDRSRCILCQRCIRTCKEIQGVGAWELVGNGFSQKVAGMGNKPISETDCESCGQCVDRCPTASLLPKVYKVPTSEVKTICPYCGVGCGIYLGLYYDQIANVRGDPENPASCGRLCVKGRFGIVDFVNSFDRLDSPLIKKNGEFQRVSWDEALDFIASKLKGYKGDSFAALASAKCTNEENYLLQKFTRAVMGTNNIDHCARLCHAPTVTGLSNAFGSGAMTNSIEDIKFAKCILAIGTNTTETHPVIGIGIRKYIRTGIKLIVANPRKISLCKNADVWLSQKPGSDVALLNGMAKVILEEKSHDQEFIENRCENFDAFKKSLSEFDLDSVEKITGIPKKDIIKAAKMYAENSPASILYAMGITQHSHGTDNVQAIANLAMLTGNIGKPGAGVNPLRGHNNVQGACDMGGLPDVFSGYQKVSDNSAQKKFEEAWKVALSNKPGLTMVEMFNECGNSIKAMYIMGENPMLSEPDINHVKESLEKLEFLVVQDIFMSETAELAEVVLPATSFAEKDGTFTNTERRVQRIRQAMEPIGQSKPDWKIISEIANKMDGNFNYRSPREIMYEIAGLTPIYGGITYERIEDAGLQWPCPDVNHPGTPILHMDTFTRGNGRFEPISFRPSLEQPDSEYPFILTTGRSLYHFHTGTMTRKVSGLRELKNEETVEINPEDAEAIGLKQGEPVKVKSRRGEVVGRVKINEGIQKGIVFMTFHFSESPTNKLTNSKLVDDSKIPELKVCAVRIEHAGEDEIESPSSGDDLDDLFD